MDFSKPKKRYVTKASFAKLCGKSCQRVNYWINHGIVSIVTFEPIEGEFIDIVEHDVEYFKKYNGYHERYEKSRRV